MQKKFSRLLYEPLIWRGDGIFKSSYTLYNGEEPIAHFRQESGIFKQDASIYLTGADEPLFILRPKGIFNMRIEAESSEIDFEPAKIKPHTWGGGATVDFLNGNSYVWKKIDFWNYKWLLTTADEFKIAKLELGRWGTTGTITVVSDDPAPAELNLLIFVGWAQYIFELQMAAAA
ncbi:MAG: hypothetical protein AAF490_27055 [Chloroflexota bacterium]